MRTPFHRGGPRRRSDAPKTSWEHVSGWYADYLSKPGNLQDAVVFPRTLGLLGARPGGRYLDVACGEGAFTRLLHAKARGAETFGVDASPGLVKRARSQAPKGAEYLVGDARDFGKLLPRHDYDGATCILAIQNIDPFEGVFRDAARGLKTGAPFVVVMNHPCFRQPRQSGWGWDEARKLQYRRVDMYLSAYEVPIQAHPGSAPHEKTFSYHRPLSAYVAALARHGFAVTAIEEWASHKTSDRGPRARAENVAREEIPLFMAIKAEKR